MGFSSALNSEKVFSRISFSSLKKHTEGYCLLAPIYYLVGMLPPLPGKASADRCLCFGCLKEISSSSLGNRSLVFLLLHAI